MTKIWIGILLSAIFLFGCKAKKEIVTNNNAKINNAVTAEPCADYDNGIVWSGYAVPEKESNDSPKAKKYKLLTVNESQLNAALIKKFQGTDGFRMFFPFYKNGVLECMEFELENSQTLSKVKQKEMSIFSFRGSGTQNAAHTIRVDYNLNQGLRAYAFIDGESYLLEPLKKGASAIYISYAKSDNDAIKTKFEIDN